MVRVFPFILKAKHKTLHVIRAWAELEILQKNNLHEFRSIKSNFRSIESNFRSIEPCKKLIVIFCNYSIPTLHTNTLSKSKNKTKRFDHGLKLKLENACEGAKTNGYGISRKGREI